MFTKSRTLQLQSLLKDNPNMEWTSENLSKALKVHTSWIYNNKQKLEAFGFKIERKKIFNQM